MSSIPGRHVPTPEFRARLERQIVSFMQEIDAPLAGSRGIGRRENARREEGRRPGWHRLRMAAVITLALGAGALGAVASAQVQESQQRALLLDAARSELELASMRLELARAKYATVRERFEVGVLDREALFAAQADLLRMEAQLRRSRLNLDEIRLAAAPPRDDLAAPLIGERDFVRERLQLELRDAQARLTEVEKALAETQRRERLGVGSELVVLEAQAEMMRARTELARLAGTIELRQRFLRESLAPGDVTREAQRLELIAAVEVAKELQRVARARYESVTERHRLGQADDLEVLRAQLAVRERDLELRLLLKQLEEFGRRTP